MSRRKKTLKVAGIELEYEGDDPAGALRAVMQAIAPEQLGPTHHATTYVDCGEAFPDDGVSIASDEVTCKACLRILGVK